MVNHIIYRMPKNESIKIFENIRNLRQLLNEGVSESSLHKAMDETKYLYIYYAGDYTILKGYRTIIPMETTEKVVKGENRQYLSAWQIAGSSDSKKKYTNTKGKSEFGWRLFRIDKIVSLLPTGRTVKKDGLPPSLDPNDFNPYSGTNGKTIHVIDIEGVKTGTTNQTQQQPTPEQIKDLYDIVVRYRKEAVNKFIVVQDNSGDLVVKPASQSNKIPPESMKGNLLDLYQKIVLPTLTKPSVNNAQNVPNNNDVETIKAEPIQQSAQAGANIVNSDFITNQENSLK